GNFGSSFTYRNITAKYTAAVVGDFDGDRCDDVFWYQPGTNTTAIWWGQTRAAFGVTARATRTVGFGYTPAAGDFDGNGVSDLFWYGPGAQPDALWWGTTTRTAFGTAALTATQSVGGQYDSATVGSFSNPYVRSRTKREPVPGLGGEAEDILWFK